MSADDQQEIVAEALERQASNGIFSKLLISLSIMKVGAIAIYAWVIYFTWVSKVKHCNYADQMTVDIVIFFMMPTFHIYCWFYGIFITQKVLYQKILKPCIQKFKTQHNLASFQESISEWKSKNRCIFQPINVTWKLIVLIANYFMGSLVFMILFYVGIVCVAFFLLVLTIGNGDYPNQFGKCGGVYNLGWLYFSKAWSDPLFYWNAFETGYETIEDILVKHIATNQALDVLLIVLEMIVAFIEMSIRYLFCCCQNNPSNQPLLVNNPA